MSALLFGSISTLADTSELQRAAFNDAFRAHGLSWEWSREDYRAMLDSNGGKARIEEYARSRGDEVDASAVHETKSRLFRESLATAGAPPRPGVVDTIAAAKAAGAKVGLVTTTSGENVAALFETLAPAVRREDFDVVVDASDVQQSKPDPAAYTFALDQLGEKASASVAVEDNVGGVHAAVAAGVTCLAFPNENTAGHDFGEAEQVVERLDADAVVALLGTAR